MTWMAAGHHITHITLDPTGDLKTKGRAAVVYAPDSSGPWQDFVIEAAAGERAETRWLGETHRWTHGRVWVAERHAWHDRQCADEVIRTCHGRPLTFRGDHTDFCDYAWIMDRADAALDRVWPQVLTLADYLVEHRQITGYDAAQLTGLAR